MDGNWAGIPAVTAGDQQIGLGRFQKPGWRTRGPPPGFSKVYRALASSSANAVFGALVLFAPAAEPVRRVPRARDAPCASVVPVAAPIRCPPRSSRRSLRERGGCAGLARSSLPSSGARSKRLMIACISSAFGASMKAKPLDSCVSGLRITLMESQTKDSAISQDWISSAVTQGGKLPRKMVKLILEKGVSVIGNWGANGKGTIHVRPLNGSKNLQRKPSNAKFRPTIEQCRLSLPPVSLPLLPGSHAKRQTHGHHKAVRVGGIPRRRQPRVRIVDGR